MRPSDPTQRNRDALGVGVAVRAPALPPPPLQHGALHPMRFSRPMRFSTPFPPTPHTLLPLIINPQVLTGALQPPPTQH